MLPKARRLTRQQFWQVQQTGQSLTHSHWAGKYLQNHLNYNRFGVVTSAKLDKRAVVRNKLRRQIYAAVAKLAGSRDVIIFPKKSMLNLSGAEISHELNQGLSKILGGT